MHVSMNSIDIILEHVPSRVTNTEAAGLDTTDGGGADNEDTLSLGEVQDLASVAFRHTLCDDGDALDLGEREDLEGARVDAAGRGKVDDNVGVGVLLNGLLYAGVNRKESLLSSPVELLDVVAAEGVNHRSDGRRLAAT